MPPSFSLRGTAAAGTLRLTAGEKMLLDRNLLFSNLSGKTADWIFVPKSRNTGGGLDCIERVRRDRGKTPAIGFRNLARAAFSRADVMYSALPFSTREKWRAAVKAPNTTAYTLWMKECMKSLIMGGRDPKEPSESGGFSTRFLPLWEDSFPLKYECTGLPWVGKLNSLSEAFKLFLPPGKYCACKLNGWMRVRLASGLLLNFQQGGAPFGITTTVSSTGPAPFSADLPIWDPVGWTIPEQAALETDNRPVKFDVAPGTEQVTFTQIHPAGSTIHSTISLAVFLRSPGLPLD